MLSSRPRWWTVPAICLLLAIVHTWPLATSPGTLSRNDNGDAQLNEWIMAWVAHQLPRAPARLFNANIFYPARDTLAFSEPLIVPALMGAPLRWLGASPVFVFNVMLIAGFALTAWAGCALVYSWTSDKAASLLAGSMFAFNTHTLTRLAHIQGIHAWGLPMALLTADRLILRATYTDALWLALWMTGMAYTSGYLVVFAAVMIPVVMIARVGDWWRRAGVVISRLALAAAITTVAVLPVYLPYRRVAREQGLVRSLENVSTYSASLKGYLASAGRIHYSTWSDRFFLNEVDTFFPGFVVIALAVLAVVWTITRRIERRSRVVMLVALAATGLVLSLGTRTPVYGWIYHVFPPMQTVRAAARFGNLFLLAMAALAGIGLAALRSRINPRAAPAVAVALVILANLESLRAPYGYTRFDGIPAIYSLLASEPGRVVLAEAPFYPARAVFENAPYVLASTVHWRPLMNGYSGFTPQSYREYAATFWYFPEEHAIQAMRRAGVTHVMVHPARFYEEGPKIMAQVAASPYLERVAVGRHGITLYRLKPNRGITDH
jgi:hypothetical protein